MAKKQAKKIFQTPRGMHDILPEDQPYFLWLFDAFREIATFYGFEKIDTPILEDTDLFYQAVGRTSDIVERQMYSFRTRGGESVTLRPEGTAPIARSYIQNGFAERSQPVKLYYFGPFFRHESPQRGRFRQFHQAGLEILGDESAISDAEIIQVIYTLFKEIGISDIFFHINSIFCKECRPAYRAALVGYYRFKTKHFCKECKRRFRKNPLRLLDCKEEKCEMLKKHAPHAVDHLCDACKKHFTMLLEYLDEIGVPYILSPHLVRGLDYYTKTVFEVFVDEEARKIKEKGEAREHPSEDPATVSPQEKETHEEPLKKQIALAAGGRYDMLIEMLGGKPTPGAGGAIGIERVMRLLKEWRIGVGAPEKSRIFFVQLGDLAKKRSFKILEMLRRTGIEVLSALSKESIKSQLKIADKLESSYALILGQREAIDGTIIIREMSSGIQETIPQEKLIEVLKKKLKK